MKLEIGNYSRKHKKFWTLRSGSGCCQHDDDYQKGFGGIGLLVLVVLITIAAIFYVGFGNPLDFIQKTFDTQRKKDLQAIKIALEKFYQDKKYYPANPGIDPFPNNYGCSRGADYRIVDLTATPVDWGSSWQFYMTKVPKDPESSKNYVYYVSCDGKSYVLFASLSRAQFDPEACNKGQPCNALLQFGISPVACSTNEKGVCNYAVSSLNVSP